MRENKVLQRMLDRLYAAMGSGPAINCRPHNSRQRIDLSVVGKLDGTAPGEIVAALLGEKGEAKLRAAVPQPIRPRTETTTVTEGETAGIRFTVEMHGYEPDLPAESTPEQKAWAEQQATLNKLRSIAEDARLYAQDTGAHVLQLGYPLLHVPPGGRSSKRILAPIAFIPVQVAVKSGRVQGVEIASAGEGVDRVIPNVALLAWMEQQTGKKLADLFADEDGADPWREIRELTAAVAEALQIESPLVPSPELPLQPTRRSDDDESNAPSLLPSAVLGLFPIASLGLIRDTEGMLGGTIGTTGPVESFLRAGVGLGQHAPPKERELLVSTADPCQARAVRLARVAKGLVIHGPPGTGKSQTITNIVGDHLARGERVLFVCDKRTALDVVHNRLEHLGLGELCAVVHDAQRDQRDLYLGIRDQLDRLPEAKVEPRVDTELQQIERELGTLHRELTEHHEAIAGTKDGTSFHDLVGAWLNEPAEQEIANVPLAELQEHERDVREMIDRAEAARFAENPWRDALGTTLDAWLARPAHEWQERLDAAHTAAQALDDAPSEFIFGSDPAAQGEERSRCADHIEQAATKAREELARWAKADPAQAAAAKAQLATVQTQIEHVRAKPQDAQLAGIQLQLHTAQIALWLGQLLTWLQVARKWYGFLFFGRRKAARAILERFGLALDATAADRITTHLEGLRTRLEVHAVQQQALGLAASLPGDAQLLHADEANRAALDLLASLPAADAAWIRARLHASDSVVAALRAAAKRGRALATFEAALANTELFASAWLERLTSDARAGGRTGALLASLHRHADTIEGLLQMRAIGAALSPALRGAVEQVAAARTEPDTALSTLRKSALAREIRRPLAAAPQRTRLDAARLKSAHDRYRLLLAQRADVVQRAVRHRWISRQKERMLAATGTRLNSMGTEVRRRLMLRGERAMKVRQVIAAGQSVDGGDPLFDLRPVWMASPQTVAQIFPAAPIFDVVVFDEASQCRLEEALPVLLRARRVVIAGDPKQLPPTRFFESGIAQSDAAYEAETEQGLFEEQQSDVEDLLGAALNLEIEQAYLDVHYRSTNGDLIEFSNRSFYESRLQAIPGHPRNRTRIPPIKLLHANGIYEKRQNRAEADAVVGLVRELLSVSEPPSIGIACFNLAQRDLIMEALDQTAADDPSFAAKLAAARSRRGAGSFEGLFVKNLENVQGDERDHMIISTTYGPDARGRFYRRFGPLGMPGGGRRLNVLVTRARQMVHLLTSIPREIYRALPPLEDGRQPNGGWLLFAYLAFAEELATSYATDEYGDAAAPSPELRIYEAARPSLLAEVLGKRALDAGHSGEVHWGNEGFTVDLAFHPPGDPAGAEGVLCDGARYDKSEDPVEWDLFRTAILEGQGWTLHRVWSPQLFRDPHGALKALARPCPQQARPASTALH